MSRRSLPALLLAACGFVVLVNAPAYAQNDPNPGNLTLIGNVDFTNAYMEKNCTSVVGLAIDSRR